VHVQEVVLLELGHPGGDLGHAVHGAIVRPFVFVAFGREDLQGHRQGELVGPAALAEIDDALAPGAELAYQAMVFGPAQPLLLDDRPVQPEQFL